MRSSLCLLVGLVMLGGAFAGCLGGKPDNPAASVSSQSAAPLVNATNNTTAVRNDGTDNMSMAAGDLPHIHDYWSGRERVTLMDADVQTSQNGLFFYTFNNLARSTPGVGGVQFTLPDGQTVYEGTGKLEFTATWTDPTVTGMGMGYKDASTTTYSPLKDVKSGAPLDITVTPAMTDMPHSKTTRWAFILEPDAAGQVIDGTIHVKVDIIKMRDVELWPGHSHLFNGAHTLTLFDGTATSSDTFFATQAADQLTHSSGEDTTTPFKSGVPMETLSMTANITIQNVNVDVGKQTNLSFMVKPANSNRFYPAHELGYDSASNTYRYAWIVDMPMTDSPYAKDSAWRFDLQVDTDPTPGGVFHAQCGGCSNAKVTYNAVIVAYDGVVDGAAKLPTGQQRGG
jgi:hypothetical protein